MTPPLRRLRRTAVRAAGFFFIALAASSCRELVLSPETQPSMALMRLDPASDRVRVPIPEGDPRVPLVREVRVHREGHDLAVRIVYDRRDPRVGLRYDPFGVGGWCFQLFLNTDQQPTGYWNGYEFLTRDSESGLDRRAVRIRHTQGPTEDGAGGWGPQTLIVPLHATRSTLTFRVPLQGLGNDDGDVDYCLELYATEACPECAGGTTHVYAYDVFGRSGARGLIAIRRPAERTASSLGHFARLEPTPSDR